MFAIHWLIFQLYLISQVFMPRQNGTYFPFHFHRTKNNGGIFPKRYQLALIYQLFIGLQMSFCKVYNYQFVKWFQKHELQNVKLALFSMRLCWYETATHFDAFASYGIAYYVGRRNVILILRFRRFTVFFQQSIIRVSKARWQERFTPPPENNSGFQNGEKFLSLSLVFDVMFIPPSKRNYRGTTRRIHSRPIQCSSWNCYRWTLTISKPLIISDALICLHVKVRILLLPA